MDELFLNVDYKGEEMELPVKAYSYGYTYRLDIQAGEDLITFEPDEEGSYRAFAGDHVDRELIGLIADELMKLK